MDSSPQHTSISSNEHAESPVSPASPAAPVEDTQLEEEEHGHVHLPNPSYWPILVSVAIALAFIGLLIINSTPVLLIIALVLVLICIIGWGLEDPMAPLKEIYVRVRVAIDPRKYKIGQNVVDSQGNWLGKVGARFENYILVERGAFKVKAFYVPVNAIKDEVKHNTLFLTMSEADLVRQGYNRVPDDLYSEVPEPGVPITKGMPQFARRPLSPAETGHYHYGKHWPGINTDASHSYLRREVNPTPQTYVTEDPVFVTDEPVPERALPPD
jgi:hypothetical protein